MTARMCTEWKQLVCDIDPLPKDVKGTSLMTPDSQRDNYYNYYPHSQQKAKFQDFT